MHRTLDTALETTVAFKSTTSGKLQAPVGPDVDRIHPEITQSFLLNHHEVILKMCTESTFSRDLAFVGSVVQLIGVLVITLLLASCGVGWEEPRTPKLNGATTTTPKYSQTMRVTINGTDLDNGLVVSSQGCTGMTRSTTPPFVSSSTQAYYLCTVSAIGNNEVSIATNTGASLTRTPYSVPLPEVTLTVANTGGGGSVTGDIILSLRPDKTPITVDNFLAYVNSGFYNGLIFHRVQTNFVIQGGGYPPVVGGQKPDHKQTNPAIALEVNKGLSNVAMTVAMARLPAPNTATSEFFINLVNNVSLDTSSGGYAVFGSVIAGANTVSAISTAPCTAITDLTAAPECTPIPNMIITSAVQTR
jgi:cyclophilin family peptidyl-prolyl cis-trans isomerase